MSINKRAIVNILKSSGYLFLANILNLCNIKETQEDVAAFIKPAHTASIYIGKKFFKYTSQEQIGIIIHELLHIPQLQGLKFIEKFFDFSKAYEKLKGQALIDFMNEDSNFFKNWYHQCKNLGLDAEVNFDVTQMKFQLPNDCVTNNNLPSFCETDAPAPEEALPYRDYIQFCLDELDPNKFQEGSSDGEGENLNSSNWEEILEPLLKEASKATEKDVQDGMSQSKSDEKLYGKVTGKGGMKIKKQLRIPPKVVSELCKVARRLKPIRGEERVHVYSWDRRHKAFPSKKFPCLKQEKFIKRTEKVVVVMDSSGSCWKKENFELGLAIVDWFKTKDLLAGFWCCDTELCKVEEGRGFNKISGGGGTAFDRGHVDEIIKDVGEDISIIYLTDGELDLTDANNRKDTHVLIWF